jgi:perosamine synthetase
MVNASIQRDYVTPPSVQGKRRRRTILSDTTRDAAGGKRAIPEPLEPLFPVLSVKGLLSRSGSRPTILDLGDFAEVTAGRYAIGIALRLLGVRPGDAVLAPACHCTAMVDPIVSEGGTPVFYKIDPMFNVDLEDAASKVTPRTKAIIASHMFGFPQDGDALRRFADHHGIALIEDCAHTLFADGVGTYGDFVIGSPRKFFPMASGGCLISSRHDVKSFTLRSPGFAEGIREAIGLIERSARYGRLWMLNLPLRAVESLRRPKAEAPVQEGAGAAGSPGDDGTVDYVATEIDLAPSGLSKMIRRATSTGWVARKRRENYRKLLDLIGEGPGFRPLFPDLPPEVVPFMAPFWVDRLEELFPSMEDAALPMQRYGQFLWRGVDESVCPVSVAMSRHLMQLACHQDLTDAEIRRFAGAFRDIVLREN